MKKIFLFLFTAAFVLTLGVAFADESMPMKPMGPVLYNGITHFDLGPATDCSGAGVSEVSGSGAGGERSAEIVKNGVTYFNLGPADATAKGYCANPRLEESPKIENGITKF